MSTAGNPSNTEPTPVKKPADSISHNPPTVGKLERVGIPRPMAIGLVGVLLFMIGDGVEAGFIAPFIADHGAGSDVHASYVITVYGVTVMIASWLSGALSRVWGPRRVMQIGAVIWVVFEVLFLAIAVPQQSYPLMIVFYGLRGFGYPLFAFGFLVWITATTPSARLSSAVGWFYFAFTGGLPTLGSLFASGVDGPLGFYGTLWCSLAIVAVGALVVMVGLKERTGYSRLAPADERPLASMVKSATIAWENPKIGVGALVRIINTAPFAGFLVFLPRIYIDKFGSSEFLNLIFLLGATNIAFNLLFGIVGDKFGWRRTITIVGSFGCTITTLLVYYLPQTPLGSAYWVSVVVFILFGATLAGFVPISALMPSLAPDNRGGAMALLNFGAGAAYFVGPLIVSVLLGPIGPGGVTIVFAALYLVSALGIAYMRLPKGVNQRDIGIDQAITAAPGAAHPTVT